NIDMDKVGAIVTFNGIVRRIDIKKKEPIKIKKLKIDSYKEMAEKALKKIENEEKKQGIINIRIVHFIGDFLPHEDLVYVVVMGSHRQECFKTLEKVINRYKKEAPIWKKEILENGEEYWIGNNKIDKQEKMGN
ncbi:MAG: hypothetical protein GF329_21220, partial [Candidatus Lokiarchaeota archaeon]|nr:hypothetical protein [Candidatus Lokiarchaeota archaeon]